MDRFKKYVKANIANADLATLVEWKKELDDNDILIEINNQIKVLVERSTYDFKWLKNASYEDFIKLTRGLDDYSEFLKKTYGEKFKAEYDTQKGLREAQVKNPLRLSYYSPEKRKQYLATTNVISPKTLPEIPYRDTLKILSSVSAYEDAKYNIDSLFYLSDNKWYGKYENQLRLDGQLLLNQLEKDFLNRKKEMLFRLKTEYTNFLKGQSGQYVNIYTFEKIGYPTPTFNEALLEKVLHPVDNRGYQKWKKWIKSAQATYASYPVWDPLNLGYQTRNRISGEYTEGGDNLFNLLEENIQQIIEEDKKEESNDLDTLLKENKRLVNQIDDITREIKKQRQEEEERIRRLKQREEKNKKDLEKMEESKTEEELEIQTELQDEEQQLEFTINDLERGLNTFNNNENIKKLSIEEQEKLKERLELQLRSTKKQQKSMTDRKKYDIKMVIPMSKMKAYIDIKKEIKSLTKEIQLVKKEMNDERRKVEEENKELMTKQQLIENGGSIDKEREQKIKKLNKELNKVIKKLESMHNIPSVSLDNLSEKEFETKQEERFDKIDKYSETLEGEDKKKWNKIIIERNRIVSKIDELNLQEEEEKDKILDKEIKDVSVITQPLQKELDKKSSERRQKIQNLEDFREKMEEKREEFADLMKSFVESGEDLETFKQNNKDQLAEFTKLFEDEVEISLLVIESEKKRKKSEQVNDQDIISEEKTEEEIIETKEESKDESGEDNGQNIISDSNEALSDDEYDDAIPPKTAKNTTPPVVPVDLGISAGKSDEDFKDANTPKTAKKPKDTTPVNVQNDDTKSNQPKINYFFGDNDIENMVQNAIEGKTEKQGGLSKPAIQDILRVNKVTGKGNLDVLRPRLGRLLTGTLKEDEKVNIILPTDISLENVVNASNGDKEDNGGLDELEIELVLQVNNLKYKQKNGKDKERKQLEQQLKRLLDNTLKPDDKVQTASTGENKIATVLKSESDFSDFDYDEFTDEEYGEWKDSSDTGSYMSD